MDQSPIQIQKWLDRYKNQVLKITKVEKGDLDEASIKLRQADLIEHEDTDDYLSPQALLLMGEGTIMTDAGRIPLHSRLMKLLSQATGQAISMNTAFNCTPNEEHTPLNRKVCHKNPAAAQLSGFVLSPKLTPAE